MLRNFLNRLGSFQTTAGQRRRGRNSVSVSAAVPSAALESRTLLASLVGGNKVTYQDIDGDEVSVTFSKSFLTDANVNSVFSFQADTVNGSNATKTFLKSINLGGIAAAAGTSIVTVSKRSPSTGGDGLATLGQIMATGLDLKDVTVDGDLGQIVAGDGNLATSATGIMKVHSLRRYGNLTRAVSADSMWTGKLNSLTVKTDVKGANLNADGDIGTITIGGSLIGLTFEFGQIISQGTIGNLKIGGDIVGGLGDHSGYISAKAFGTLNVTGSVLGGGGSNSGGISSTGYSPNFSGTLTIGSIVGGSGHDSGTVILGRRLASVKILGDVVGGLGNHSGGIYVVNGAKSVTIGGSVIGNEGDYSGYFNIGPGDSFTLGGSIFGGSGEWSGSVDCRFFGTAKINGGVIGGMGNGSGSYQAQTIDSLTIAGDIVGGSATGNENLQNSGGVFANDIKSMTLGGSLRAGYDFTTGNFGNNGVISVSHDIDSLLIKGSVIGNSTNRAIISAHGKKNPPADSDLAIGKLTVNGRVESANILAGYDNWLNYPNNADAQIGTFIVNGDWITSNLVAGVGAGVDGKFGNADDVVLSGMGVKNDANVSSQIKAITIGGQVVGTSNGAGDHYGFVAQNISSFKMGDTAFALMAGNSNDDLLLSPGINASSQDVRLNEI